MPRVRQLLNAAAVETAKRRRICHHSRKQHAVLAGDKCLVLTDPTSGGSKNYCLACATAILDRAQEDLDDLRAELVA